ncbi:FAD-dependent oxidoreductase [Phytohabitans sp. ZYX-F-186]|uniref:ferredoxin--NADP(+) reductase n=1 Tax=Phytohabitans maris TaxID=3071409 RepID=A0ABU0ZKA4_9ACTN|nr:FAD-dependent oxidoreductase [Phytohabitans sp. ZYX-F-186]MDQ7907474.1 FAD-dependent oxidoreductase [Phytohabitans sp. ZYX-F-186]
MTHVITQSCCDDAACTAVCPVDCIQPAPGTPGFAAAEMLYIDPATCIDCGCCVPECPVDAIRPDLDLPPSLHHFAELNAAYFEGRRPGPVPPRSVLPPSLALDRRLRIAVVGAGPAGLYAALDLLETGGSGAAVDVYDRLPTPGGLIRYGVAPDHPSTKLAAEAFAAHAGRPHLRFRFGVEVGSDLTPAELGRAYDAVVYAVGAAGARTIGIPGEDLPGSLAAAEFVAWYNGHPDAGAREIDLSGPRAVVIGNGNVALDVARLLVSDPALLAGTDMAQHAVEALSRSGIREVLVVGRRGPLQAAFTTAELTALERLPGVDVVAEREGLDLTPAEERTLAADPILRARYAALRRLATGSPGGPARPRIRLRFLARPERILGSTAVTGVRLRRQVKRDVDGAVTFRPAGAAQTVGAGLVLTSVGYLTVPLPGLPYDGDRGVVRNADGRIVDEDGRPVPGAYVVGWAKRGPNGVIGTNKHCASATVQHLRSDASAGRLAPPVEPPQWLDALLAERCRRLTDWAGWTRLDRHERAAGQAVARPRVKVTSLPDMWRITGREG